MDLPHTQTTQGSHVYRIPTAQLHPAWKQVSIASKAKDQRYPEGKTTGSHQACLADCLRISLLVVGSIFWMKVKSAQTIGSSGLSINKQQVVEEDMKKHTEIRISADLKQMYKNVWTHLKLHFIWSHRGRWPSRLLKPHQNCYSVHSRTRLQVHCTMHLKDIRASTYSWISIIIWKKTVAKTHLQTPNPAMPAKPVPEDQAAKHDWRARHRVDMSVDLAYYSHSSALIKKSMTTTYASWTGIFAVQVQYIGFSNICRIRIQIVPRNPRILE